MTKQIEINNFKGVKHLTFDVPSSGVYILTGKNGCGKTSLLMALNRLGDKQAFAKIQVGRDMGFDEFKHTDIKYTVDNKSIHYNRTKKGWYPSPRGATSDLQRLYGFPTTYFITTSGIRFYQTEPNSLEKKRGNIAYQPASPQIIDALNTIFDTQRFSNLQFATIKSKRGRQKLLHRNNKLYTINDGNERYSEINFSLGERLILNVLDFIESISSKALLIIDEIELALHPIAQIEFYKYIKQLARGKQLTCIISTHSASLVKAADQRIYLENNDGEVSVLTSCQPSYILKDITVQEDSTKDYLFFVEDKMAWRYLTKVIRLYQQHEDKNALIGIIPVGGYEQVIELMKQFKAVPPYNEKRVHVFLDKDVETTIQEIKDKEEKTDADNRKLDLFREQHEWISYLNITPEEGIWNWLGDHTSDYEDAIKKRYGQGILSQRFFAIKSQVDAEEEGKGGTNLRTHAKGCFKNILERLHNNVPIVSEDEFLDLLFDTYVDDTFNNEAGLNRLKSKIKPVINKAKS